MEGGRGEVGGGEEGERRGVKDVREVEGNRKRRGSYYMSSWVPRGK